MVELFELLGVRGEGPDAATDAATALCHRWTEAIQSYRQRDWDRALRQFRSFAEAYPEDSVAPIYIARCMTFIATPPPANWDGAEHFSEK